MRIRIAFLVIFMALALGMGTAPKSAFADGCADPNTEQEECIIDTAPPTGSIGIQQFTPFQPGVPPGSRISITITPNWPYYRLWTPVTVCYNIPLAGNVQILDYTITGVTVVFNTSVNGSGCLSGSITPPVGGRECLRMAYQPAQSQGYGPPIFGVGPTYYAGKCFFTGYY